MLYSYAIHMSIQKAFRFTAVDISLLEEWKEKLGATDYITVIRKLLRSHLANSPAKDVMEQDHEDTIKRSAFDFNAAIAQNIYKDWEKVAAGNDPERGDWIGIKQTVKPWASKTLWSDDIGFDNF